MKHEIELVLFKEYFLLFFSAILKNKSSDSYE